MIYIVRERTIQAVSFSAADAVTTISALLTPPIPYLYYQHSAIMVYLSDIYQRRTITIYIHPDITANLVTKQKKSLYQLLTGKL